MTEALTFPKHLARRFGFALAALVALAAWVFAPSPVQAQARIKDIVAFEGVRDNLLVGYGLVVGLNGTGDDLKSAPFTRESLIGMVEAKSGKGREKWLRKMAANGAAGD